MVSMYVCMYVCVCVCVWCVYVGGEEVEEAASSISFFFHFKVGGLCLARATPPAAFVLADGSRRRWLISNSANLRHSSSLSFSFFFSLQGHVPKTNKKFSQPETKYKKKKFKLIATYFCLSVLYVAVNSSNSFEFISIKVLRTL